MKDKLKSLMAKIETYKIETPKGPVELQLHGLSFSEVTEIAGYNDKKDTKGGLQYLMFTALRHSLPVDGEEPWTDDEVRELSNGMASEPAGKLISKVMELSGMEAPQGFQQGANPDKPEA